MAYPDIEEKVFAIVDETLSKFKSNSTIVFDNENRSEEYLLAKNLMLDYGLVKFVIPSDKKQLLVLTSIGADVVSKGSIKNSLTELERQKELKNKLKFEKIQNDINNHIQTRKLTTFLMILISIGFILWVIKWVMGK